MGVSLTPGIFLSSRAVSYPVHDRQLDIEQDENGPAFRGKVDPLSPVMCPFNCIAFCTQNIVDQVEVLVIVLDIENFYRHDGLLSTGIVKLKVLPLPHALVTVIVPPIRVTSRFEMESPRPGTFVLPGQTCLDLRERSEEFLEIFRFDPDTGIGNTDPDLTSQQAHMRS